MPSVSEGTGFNLPGLSSSETFNHRLVINGHRVTDCQWYPANPMEKIRKDTISPAGSEFEKEFFRGRTLFTFMVSFKGRNDKARAEMVTLSHLIIPPISDVGIRTQPPRVHTIEYQPLAEQLMTKFSVDQHSRCIFWNDSERCWQYDVQFKLFSQYQMSALPFVDMDKVLSGSSFVNTPGQLPSTPSIASPNSVEGLTGFGQ